MHFNTRSACTARMHSREALKFSVVMEWELNNAQNSRKVFHGRLKCVILKNPVMVLVCDALHKCESHEF